MNDCQDVTMREALPELLHGQLADGERRLVEAHVAVCADCTDELAILRAVLATARVPAVDTTRIVAMIAPYKGAPVTSSTTTLATGVTQQPDIIPLRSRGVRHARFSRLQLAAALALAAVGVSTATVVARERQQGPATAVVAHSATPSAGQDPGVALVATADLSDAQLATLINDMNSMQALPPAEPEPIAPAVDGGV